MIQYTTFTDEQHKDGFFKNKTCVVLDGRSIYHNIDETGVYVWTVSEAIQDPAVGRMPLIDPSEILLQKTEHGVALIIAEKKILQEPIYILHKKMDSASLRTIVFAGEMSEAKIVEVFLQDQDIAVGLQVQAARQANITYVKTVLQGKQTKHASIAKCYVHKDASIKSYTCCLRAQTTSNHLEMNMLDEGAVGLMDGVFIGKGHQKIENYTMAAHQAANTESFENYKGILDDQAKGVFQGRVFVARHAQKTNAKQMNRNILLSEDASIETSPELEILADDVKCSHGATVGRMDPEQLFYLRSRGISKLEAEKMMIRAFVAEVIEGAVDTDFLSWMYERIEDQLHAAS
ncbi:MAG: Fe-S cluster assembly protein SufD [Deltaproteobacteria bacterium]|nr:Fe-S cluster assembly protein SufD [Deltaproteobacteria bacterium]